MKYEPEKYGLFSQRDPRWSRKTLGHTVYTIYYWGCTICSICMMIFYLFKAIIYPHTLAKMFKFMDDGRLIWSSVKFRKGGKKLKFIERQYYAPTHKQMTDCVNMPNKAMLVEINRSHWVLLREWSRWKLWWWLCGDPWKFPARFVKRTKREITGYATFEVVDE